MNESGRFAIEIKAHSNKPAYGEPCNNCGWCCIVEVCSMGEYYEAEPTLPCEFLTSDYRCELILNGTIEKKVLGIGKGCDAQSQSEILNDLLAKR